ncbi:MAG: DUF448 domain-containing protein [Pseudomonadota bacterium]
MTDGQAVDTEQPRPAADACSRAENHATRTCLVTGQSKARAQMIRFVRGPDGDVVADLAEKLPGRGVWVSAERAHLQTALARSLFKKGFKSGDVGVHTDAAAWVDAIASLQKARCLNLIGLARRGGLLVTGFENVRSTLRGLTASKAGHVILLVADDAAADSRTKLTRLAAHVNVAVIEVFSGTALADAAGLDKVRFMALVSKADPTARAPALAHRFLAEVIKYQNLLPPEPATP